MLRRLRIMMPSIVDPRVQRGGAWTVTRGLVDLIHRAAGDAEIVCIAPTEPSWRRTRQAFCALAAPFTGVPAKIHFLRSRAFRNRVRRMLADEPYDLLVINGSDLLWCIDHANPQTPALAVIHNREADLYRDQVMAMTQARLVRFALLADRARLDRFETEALRRVDASVFLSAGDAAQFVAQIPSLNHLVVPPLFTEVPERIARDRSVEGLHIGFLANFGWWPNRDGLDWLVREVLPHLASDVRLHLFGHRSMDVKDADPRLVIHGFVDDLRRVWRTCDWMAVPTRSGSGVSVKTAESLYHGMPIISTSFGLRGLPPVDHPQVVIRDDARQWVSFLRSPQSRDLCRERLPHAFSVLFRPETYERRFSQLMSHLLRSAS